MIEMLVFCKKNKEWMPSSAAIVSEYLRLFSERKASKKAAKAASSSSSSSLSAAADFDKEGELLDFGFGEFASEVYLDEDETASMLAEIASFRAGDEDDSSAGGGAADTDPFDDFIRELAGADLVDFLDETSG
jgi:hypothetical protein